MWLVFSIWAAGFLYFRPCWDGPVPDFVEIFWRFLWPLVLLCFIIEWVRGNTYWRERDDSDDSNLQLRRRTKDRD